MPVTRYSRPASLAGLVQLIIVGVACAQPGDAGSSDPQVAQIVRGIKDNQKRLLQISGGLAFKFRVESEQRERSPYFLYPDGVDGDFRVKWPKLRNEFQGVMHGIIELDATGKANKVAKKKEVVASYDFDTNTTVLLQDGDTAMIVGKRGQHTSRSVYPFSLQGLVEFSELYFPGEELQTDYWLPNALQQHAYRVVGQETVDDIPCQVLELAGTDKLWIAPDRGHVVLRRELRWGESLRIREKLWTRQLRQVAPGVWMPLEIVRDDFDKDNADNRLVRYLVTIKDLQVGNLTDDQLAVQIPEGIKMVRDHASGTVSYLGTSDDNEESRLLASIRAAEHRVAPRQKNNLGLQLLLLNTVVILGGVIVFLYRRWFRTLSPGR